MINNKLNNHIITITVLYVAALIFVMFGIGTECYHIMQHPAFLTDWDYLKDFLKQPGGLGEYLSLFIEQFFNSYFGGVLLIGEILLAAWLLNKLTNKIFNINITSKSLLWLLPLFVSVMCFNNIYFAFQILSQFVIMLIVINILHIISAENKLYVLALAIGAIAVYHFCGPLYLYCFSLSEIIIAFATRKPNKIIISSVALAAATFYPAILYRFVLAITPKYIFYYPVSQRAILEMFQPVIFAFYIILPLSIVIQYFINKKEKPFKYSQHLYYGTILLMIVALIVVYQQKEFKHQRFAAKISYESECENWEYVINKSFKCGFYNRTVNFYYNLALAKTSTMGRYLFEYPQLLGNEALTIEEPLAGDVCYPTSTLYFQMGQISNSLRYAYESAIYYQNSPYIMRRIIDCLIISNRFSEAEIFLNQLNRNMLAKSFVKDRRSYIAGARNSLITEEFVQSKQKESVKRDYIMSPAYRNYEQLMLSNTNNQVATDYMLSFCLLNNDLDNFINVLVSSHYNLQKLPKHYKEAVVLYLSKTQTPNPKTNEIVIDNDTKARFNTFTQIASNAGSNTYNILKQDFSNTYWMYYTFDNPMRKNISIKNSTKQ